MNWAKNLENAPEKALDLSSLIPLRTTNQKSGRAQEMNSSEVQFGLSLDLLQLDRDRVLISDVVLESLSMAAQRRVRYGRPPIGILFWQDVIVAGIYDLIPRHDQLLGRQAVPFVAQLLLPLFRRVMPLAERAGLCRTRGDSQFEMTEQFLNDFSGHVANLSANRFHARRALFRTCLALAGTYCIEHDPSNIRHSALVAISLFNLLYAEGTLAALEVILLTR
jgi:hypothetical protein